MERTTKVAKITLALCLLCTLSFAQRPKVSVYVSEQSGYSDDVKNALRVATMNVLVRGGKYEIVDRSSVIDEELSKQASGAVDDDQMVAFGRQAGAKYVCVSDITSLGSYYVPARYDSQGRMISQGYSVHPHQVSARIIDVETAQLVGLGVIDQDIQNGPAMSIAITKAVEKMLETMQTQIDYNLPKRAVYVQGGRRDVSSTNALYTYTIEALFTRSRYNGDFVVVERSEAFTRQIDREQGKQHSGSVADGEISRMGKQYGIAEICIASIEPVMGTYNINARLVNVERASVVNASELRHLPMDNSPASNLSNLRKIAVRMIEDMIPRKITEAELEEEKQVEAEREEITRTAWMAGYTIGGGVSFNMNEIDPNYFSSLGGQFNLNFDFYKRNLKFIQFGFNLDAGGIGKERDYIRKMYPTAIIDDDTLFTYNFKLNAFIRLCPVDFLFLSGGAGYAFYGIQSKMPKPDNSSELESVTIVSISTPVFPVGGGIFIGSSDSDGKSVGFVIEALYNIVPFKGRTAGYMSINAGLNVNLRLTKDKKYVREDI